MIPTTAMISKTGIIHGSGSDRYKWVSNLTKEEREFVRNGGLVLIEIHEPKQNQTQYKQVTCYSGKFGHRNYKGD